MSTVIVMTHAVITLSRLWIIFIWGATYGLYLGYWLLGFRVLNLDAVGWDKALVVGQDDVVRFLTALFCMTVAVMPRYFVRKSSIIQAACILLCLIAIGGSISVFDALLEGDSSLLTDISIVALLVILVELICLKKLFDIETSPSPDDASSLDEEEINRFILVGQLFLTIIVSAYSLLSLEGVWVKYLKGMNMFLIGSYLVGYLAMCTKSEDIEEPESHTEEGISQSSYRYTLKGAQKSLCVLNLAVGIIGHHVILASVVVGIWINGYPAEWLCHRGADQITYCQSHDGLKKWGGHDLQ